MKRARAPAATQMRLSADSGRRASLLSPFGSRSFGALHSARADTTAVVTDVHHTAPPHQDGRAASACRMPAPVQHLIRSMFAGVQALDVDAGSASMSKTSCFTTPLPESRHGGHRGRAGRTRLVVHADEEHAARHREVVFRRRRHLGGRGDIHPSR